MKYELLGPSFILLCGFGNAKTFLFGFSGLLILTRPYRFSIRRPNISCGVKFLLDQAVFSVHCFTSVQAQKHLACRTELS